MVVLRRRQVACIRMGLITCLIGAGLVFVYHYVDNNDYQKQMEDAIKILERDTENGLAAINDLEKHLEDIDIQPKPEAQYVVYNRVPKCGSMSMTTLCYKLGGKNSFKVESPYEPGEQPKKTREQEFEFIDYLKAQEAPYMYIRHQYYIDFSELAEDVSSVYINMIRDPIDRFESFYYFSRFGNVKGGGGKAKLSEIQKLETVDQCVERRRKECIQPVWQVVPYLCGSAPVCQERSRDALERAKLNVEKNYLFVGVLEELPLSLNILEHLLPHFFKGALDLNNEEAALKMKAETVTNNKKPASEETRRFLKEETSLSLEYELYDFVLDRIKRIQNKFKIESPKVSL